MKVTERIFMPFDGCVVFRHTANHYAVDRTVDIDMLRQMRFPTHVVAEIRIRACNILSDRMPGSPEPTWAVGCEQETLDKTFQLADHFDPVVREDGFETK